MSAQLHIFEDLVTANSRQQVSTFLKRHCDELGFSRYLFSPIFGGLSTKRVFKETTRIAAADELIHHGFVTSFPDSWVYRYQEARHEENDPVLKTVLATGLPFVWSDAERLDPDNIVMDEACQHGLRDGITVPAFGRNSSQAVFSVVTDVRSTACNASAVGSVLLTALYLLEVVNRRTDQQGATPLRPLTSREKDCLQWAAQGKTSWEIAGILSISERTAVFHIANAAKKLGATNRRQAVVRAITLGLIAP